MSYLEIVLWVAYFAVVFNVIRTPAKTKMRNKG
jgi:hypothetical protein